MTENPYKTPPSEDVASVRLTPARSVRLSVMAALLLASLITAGLVTPADPASSFLAAIPIFGISMAAYYFGLRQGAKPEVGDRK